MRHLVKFCASCTTACLKEEEEEDFLPLIPAPVIAAAHVIAAAPVIEATPVIPAAVGIPASPVIPAALGIPAAPVIPAALGIPAGPVRLPPEDEDELPPYPDILESEEILEGAPLPPPPEDCLPPPPEHCLLPPPAVL